MFTINSIKIGALLILLAVTTACSIITETECRFADFSQLGYADASKGKLRDQFNKYYAKCLTYDIDLSEELVMYDMGRERGLHNYCEQVRYSAQCDRGSQIGRVKSSKNINSEMIRLQSLIPPVGF